MSNEINLFCLPFAGGSRYSYHSYKELSPPFLNFIPLELPGRGTRIRQALLTDINLMVDDLFSQMQPLLDKPYAIYGHSMGTFLGYLIAKRIVDTNLYNKPLHLFFTGCRAPSVASRDTKRHLMPKAQFIEKLKEYGGSPDEILNDKDLTDFFEPIIRADFRGIENYIYQETEPFDIPITVMIGLDEPVTREDAEAWQKETSVPIEVHQFPGKHFFIFENQENIVKIMARSLQQLAIRSSSKPISNQH